MQTFYKFKHYDINVGKNSSSGGAFTMISDRILESGGVVYGCVLNEKFNAIHIRAERKEQRDKMRGSKYIQSNILVRHSSKLLWIWQIKEKSYFLEHHVK